MSGSRETQVLVLGLGAVGAAVAYQLSRRGVPFMGIERQPPPPYLRGSSQGETRITRVAVGEGEAYVPLVRRSHEIWRELEAAGGPPLLNPCGALYLAYDEGGGVRHGADAFVGATRRVGEAAGVRLERLDASALRQRFPQFAVTDDTVGYFEPDAGFVWPERCIQAQLDAVADRSQLRFEERVLACEQTDGVIRVTTDRGTYEAERAVVAMGAWIPDFIGGPFQDGMQVLRQTLHWFEADEPALWRVDAAPAFLWFHGPGEADVFYGFPLAPGGRPGVKVATEDYAATTAPDDMVETVPEEHSAALYRQHAASRLRGVSHRRIDAKACLYTYNAAEPGRFRIGSAPQAPRALVVSACSGHGFKHSAGLGEAIVQTLLGEPALCDLSQFAPGR